MYNRKLIISEEEKKSILNLHESKRKEELGLISEDYDQNTKTYSTEAGLVMYGDLYNSESAKTVPKGYVIKFPLGSKATMYSSSNPVSKGVTLKGGQMSLPPKKGTVSVSLICGQKSFTYYDAGSGKTITLYNTGLESFVTKMDNIFCKGKIPGKVIGGGDNRPTTTPTIDKVKDCKNKLSFTQGMKGEEVKRVQGLLGVKYSALLGTKQYDGNFGPATKKAVIQFQKDNGLTPNGIVDCNTLNKLTGQLSVTNQAPKQVDPNLAIGDQSSAVNLTQGNQSALANIGTQPGIGLQ